MTIGLSNSAKRSANYGSTVNQNQGGGSKKAGIVPTSNESVATKLAFNHYGYPKSVYVMSLTRFPKTSQSRPIGPVANVSKSLNGRFNW
jgi:hypothetical protein